MRTIFLHGLGQNAHDWEKVTELISDRNFECLSLFPASGKSCSYSEIFCSLEERLAKEQEPFCICGISLGAILALDYTIRYRGNVAYLVLIGCQYKVPTLLIDMQNVLFRCMPKSAFEDSGLSKSDMIELARSMRKLDFSDSLNMVCCPVTIVCGEKDSANKKASQKLNVLLPQSELLLIPDVGHEVNKHAPKSIATILNR